METLIIHSETNKINALIEFLKAFDISFEKKNATVKPYNQEFTKTLNKSINEAKTGKLTTVSLDDIWKSN